MTLFINLLALCVAIMGSAQCQQDETPSRAVSRAIDLLHDHWCSNDSVCVSPTSYYGLDIATLFSKTGVYTTDPLLNITGALFRMNVDGTKMEYVKRITTNNAWAVHTIRGDGTYLVEAGSHQIRWTSGMRTDIVAFAGVANTPGDIVNVGTLSSQWNSPVDFSFHAKVGAMFVSDRGNNAVKRIKMSTRVVTRLCQFDTPVSGTAHFRQWVFTSADTASVVYRTFEFSGVSESFIGSKVVTTPMAMWLDCAASDLFIADAGKQKVIRYHFPHSRSSELQTPGVMLKKPAGLLLENGTLYVAGGNGQIVMVTLETKKDQSCDGPARTATPTAIRAPVVPPEDDKCDPFLSRDDVAGRVSFLCFGSACPSAVCGLEFDIPNATHMIVSVVALNVPPGKCAYPYFQVLSIPSGESLLPTGSESVGCNNVVSTSPLSHSPWDPFSISGPRRITLRVMSESSAASSTFGFIATFRFMEGITPPALPDHSAERTAFMFLYVATNGPTWKVKTNWGDNSVGVCSWFGVRCETSLSTAGLLPIIVAVDLTGNNLTGSLPANLGDLCGTDLRRMLLGYKNNVRLLTTPSPGQTLSGTIPDSLFQKCRQLQALELQGHTLFGTFPVGFGNLTSLRHLNISANRFNGTLPAAAMAGMLSMTNFSVAFNMLSGPLPDAVAIWSTTLEILHVASNAFVGTLPSFDFFSRLALLDLSQNVFEGTLPSLRSKEPSVVFARFYSNKFSGTMPITWGVSMSRAVHILIHLNQLEGTIPSEFTAWKRVKNLDVTGNRFSGPLDIFFRLMTLELLHAGKNMFTGGIVLRAPLPFLEEIDISFNRINGTIPRDLQTFLPATKTRQGSLYLGTNSWACDLPEGFPQWKDFVRTTCYEYNADVTVVRNASVVDNNVTLPLLVRVDLTLSFASDFGVLLDMMSGERITGNDTRGACCGARCHLSRLQIGRTTLFFQIHPTAVGVLTDICFTLQEASTNVVTIKTFCVPSCGVSSFSNIAPQIVFRDGQQQQLMLETFSGVGVLLKITTLPWRGIQLWCNFSFGLLLPAVAANHTDFIRCTAPLHIALPSSPTAPESTVSLVGRTDDIVFDTAGCPAPLVGPPIALRVTPRALRVPSSMVTRLPVIWANLTDSAGNAVSVMNQTTTTLTVSSPRLGISPQPYAPNITIKIPTAGEYAFDFIVNLTSEISFQTSCSVVVIPGTPRGLLSVITAAHTNNKSPFMPQPLLNLVDAAQNVITREMLGRDAIISARLLVRSAIGLVHSSNLSYINFNETVVHLTHSFVYESMGGRMVHGFEYSIEYKTDSVPGAPLIVPLPLPPCSHAYGVPYTLTCEPCPEGLICDGTAATKVQSGYWRPNNITYVVVKCAHPEVCVGSSAQDDGICKVGTSGVECAACRKEIGYGESQEGCTACQSKWITALRLIAVACVGIMSAAALVFANLPSGVSTGQGPNYSIVLKIFINYFQVSALTRSLDVDIGTTVRSLFYSMGSMSTVDRNLHEARCLSSTIIHQYNIFVLCCFFPLIIALVSVPISYVTRVMLTKRYSKIVTEQCDVDQDPLFPCSNCDDDYAAMSCDTCGAHLCSSCDAAAHLPLSNRTHTRIDTRYLGIAKNVANGNITPPPTLRVCFITTFVMLLFFVFPGLMAQVASVMTCGHYYSATVDPHTQTITSTKQFYLLSEVSVDCDTNAWHTYAQGAACVYIGYGVVVPFLIGIYLYGNRAAHAKQAFLGMFGFLYGNYTRKFFYWEMIILLRKTLFVAIVAGVYDKNLKVHACVWVLLFNAVANVVCAPFRFYGWLENMSLGVQIITLSLVALLPPILDLPPSAQTLATVAIFLINAGVMLVFVCCLVREVRRESSFYMRGDPFEKLDYPKVLRMTKRYIKLLFTGHRVEGDKEDRDLLTFIRDECGDAAIVQRRMQILSQQL